VLHAVGRIPGSRFFGPRLERAGVKLDPAGAVIVDVFSQSQRAVIYSIGDVTIA